MAGADGSLRRVERACGEASARRTWRESPGGAESGSGEAVGRGADASDGGRDRRPQRGSTSALLGVVGLSTRLGGHDGRGDNHSDKGEGDKKVMHGAFSLSGT